MNMNLALRNLQLILLCSLLGQFVRCVEEKVRDGILHSSSYAEAYEKYLEAFQQKDGNVWSGALHLSPEQRKAVEEKEKCKQRRFIKSVKQCNKHNRNFDEGISEYSQTVNFFTIMEDEEKKMYTGFLLANSTDSLVGRSMRVKRQYSNLLRSSLPKSLSWLRKGYVTKVKNQENCGSCWAYGSIVPLEHAYKKITGNLISLSEQELLDCTSEGYGGPPDGCKGNWPHFAYNFVINTQSVPTERSYPYKNRDLPCRSKKHKSAIAKKFKVTGYQTVDSVQGAMSALAKHGPLVVACYTGNDFFSYNKGIYDGCHSWKQSNHAVAMVGYDANSWLIKNSWGEEWGDGGYIRMKRRNVCGVLDYALYIQYKKVPGYVPKKDENDESPPPPRCEDKGKESENMHCAYWKTLGHCESKKWYMAKFCADTCALCDYKPNKGGRNRGRTRGRGNRGKGRRGRGRKGRKSRQW